MTGGGPPPRGGLRGAVRRHVGGMPATFWLLWTGVLVNRMGTFVVPFLALYVTRGRGYSEATAGAVLLAWGLGGLPSQPVGGALADRVGRVRTLLGSTVAAAAAMLALSAARTPGQLIVAAGALGFVSEMYRPASSALVADTVAVSERPRAFALLFWAINLGFAGAAAAGGFLAEVSWTWLFVGDALTTLAFGVLVAVRIPEPDRPAAPRRPLHDALATVGRDRLFLGVLGLTVLYAAAYAQVMSTLSVQIVADGLTAADYGTIIALNGVVIVLVQPFVLGRVSRWAPGVALAVGSAVVGVGLGATVLVDTWTGFALTVVVWTLGEIVIATFAAPVVADLSPADMRGRYLGWFGFAHATAFAFAPAVGLAAFGRYGGAAVWLTCLVIGLVAAAGWLILRPGIVERRAAAAAAA